MADLIKKELGTDAEMILGEPGEFAVLVDGQTVAKMGIFIFPSARKCVEAVRQAIGA